MFKLVEYIKYSIKEFIILALWVVFFFALATYLLYYKNIKDLTTFVIQFVGPLAILTYGAAHATQNNLNKKRRSQKQGEGEGEFTITLNFMDLLRHEVTAFVVALVILVVPYIFMPVYSWIYVFNAFFAFLAIWWLKMFYFRQ